MASRRAFLTEVAGRSERSPFLLQAAQSSSGSGARKNLFKESVLKRMRLFQNCAEQKDKLLPGKSANTLRQNCFREMAAQRRQLFANALQSRRTRSNRTHKKMPAAATLKSIWKRVKCFKLKFSSAADTFAAPQHLVETMRASTTAPLVEEALSRFSNLVVTTSFSGAGFAELGLQALAASKKQPVNFGRAVEVDQYCREMLMSRHKSSCVFGNLMDLVVDLEMGTVEDPPKCSVAKQAYCYQHGKMCQVAPCRKSCQSTETEMRLEVAGPPCPPWSRFGKRRGVDDERHKVHDAWVALCREEEPDLILFENVIGFRLELLSRNFADKYLLLPEILDPRIFGAPMSRPRFYCLLVHKRRRWKGTEPTWLMDAAKAAGGLIAGGPVKDMYDSSIYTELADDGSTRPLTSVEQTHLQQYKNMTGRLKNAAVVDLSQSKGRPVGSLVDGALPTLRTSCRSLYMRHSRQFLSSFQLLRAMGYPVHAEDAAELGVTYCPIPKQVPTKELFTMAGNGMYAPCVSLAVLIALMCTAS